MPKNGENRGEKPPKGKKKLRVLLRTFGCQMNVRDSEIILGMLKEKGYAPVSKPDQAELVLFNTCSVRQHAEERVWGQAGMIKKRGARPVIGIVGCMAQNYQEQIFRRLPQVDFVCGPANIYDIPLLIEKALKEHSQLLAVNMEKRPLLCDNGYRISNLKAFVSIMYGCNNFCSYCIVPYVRGREVSRPLRHILAEVQDLAARGFKEITLLGQNVNSYGKDLPGPLNFVRLLENLDRIKGIERIRFVTSHPKDATPELFKAMRNLASVCEHLHLPLQAGSDKILHMMNRNYTLKDYLKLVDVLRRQVPDSAISTDIIVGFPGETEKDFKKTEQAMKDIQFDEAFVFKYSPRFKTKAAEFKDDVSNKKKLQRNHRLLELQGAISLKKNKHIIGSTEEVLAEGKGSYFQGAKKKQAVLGRSRSNKVTLFPGKMDLISKLVRVRIKRTTAHTLIGEVDDKKN